MSGPSFADVLRAAIDPVVVPAGFASGQGSTDQTIFCGDTQAVWASFPGLPWDDLGTDPGRCVDLVVDGDLARGVTEARLDGIPLERLLRANGLDAQAAELEAVMGEPVQVAGSVVAASFARLLAVTAAAV